ncbi:MAG: Tfp pilus assembly protein FimT/FimU [Bacteriovoracia bacterium]
MVGSQGFSLVEMMLGAAIGSVLLLFGVVPFTSAMHQAELSSRGHAAVVGLDYLIRATLNNRAACRTAFGDSDIREGLAITLSSPQGAAPGVIARDGLRDSDYQINSWTVLERDPVPFSLSDHLTTLRLVVTPRGAPQPLALDYTLTLVLDANRRVVDCREQDTDASQLAGGMYLEMCQRVMRMDAGDKEICATFPRATRVMAAYSQCLRKTGNVDVKVKRGKGNALLCG